MLLNHSRVIDLGSGDAVTHGVIEQFFNGTWSSSSLTASSSSHSPTWAEGIGDLVICPAYVLNLKVVSSHCRHPPMLDSVQIGCHHEVGQQIVVSADQEGLVLQILPKLFSHSPLESQELQFRRVVFQLASLEAATSIGDGMVMAVILPLESITPNPSIEASVSSRKGFLKSANANTGAMRHFILSSWNAAKVSGGSPTG